ncbi:unnamed protein product [Somion occarium]|uniref:Uncharacterized protein n=1 Tax=Somion occarium TaxID=3059160 RepID=A0ABP1CYG7_9APHY
MSTSVATTRATFVIYQDEPSTSAPPKLKSTASAPSVLRLSSGSASRSTLISIPTASDKENVDPLTGRRPCLEDTLAKKRKPTPGNVLATKILISSSKVLKDTIPEPKKRKILCSSNSKSNSSSERKERKPLVSRRERAQGSSRAQKVAELPKVAEEEEEAITVEPGMADEKTQERNEDKVKDEEGRVAQALVDARCYELTVLPLADVSRAYCQSSDSSSIDDEIVAAGEKLKTLLTEDTTSTTQEQLAQKGTLEKAPSKSPETPSKRSFPSNPAAPAFSTPERMRIYSAFTFSSPSLAGRRYAVSRGSGVDSRFSDLEFKL